MDFMGLDTALDVAKSYGLSSPILEEKVEREHLGAKTSRGFYDYGGRSELEILEKRDNLYIKMLSYLESAGTFEPV